MRKLRDDLERDEAMLLAPYGQRVSESAGRLHPEPPHPSRTAYQRDRARVIHSRAFRRLEYKTQVFLNGTGDHLRTRLTHTMEVASVSRTVAKALGLNEELAEVVALAHDLGHAPFGHAGEKRLDDLMAACGGFDHNRQSLRVVEHIESRYPEFPGLNLSYEVLEGLRKHEPAHARPATGVGGGDERFPSPGLEAQIADLADEITYYSHDLDDGIDHGLIRPEQLDEIDLWRVCRDRVRADFPRLSGAMLTAYVIRVLIDFEVEDVIATTERRIVEAGVGHADDVRRRPGPLAGYSEGLASMNRELRAFLHAHLYHHPSVEEANARGADRIEAVFRHYLAHPERLGARTASRLHADGLERTVCDYVSGMTDRYLLTEADRIG